MQVAHLEIRVSDRASLVHDSQAGQGATALMAKGLYLCLEGRVCSGESAGFGLPVFRSEGRTFFPTLESLENPGNGVVEMVFSLDRELFWHLAGKRAPACLTRVSEFLVRIFMGQPAFQTHLLELRDRVLALLSLEGRMLPVQGIGHCRVSFFCSGSRVHIRADGTGISKRGSLIMLNEVEGKPFDQVIAGNAQLEGSRIPAWMESGFSVELRSPRLGAGIALFPGGPGMERARVFCGREVARGLDWAGLALSVEHASPSYGVCIRY